MLLKSKTITKEEILKLQDKYAAGISDKQKLQETNDHWAGDIDKIRKDMNMKSYKEGDFYSEPLSYVDIKLRSKKYCVCCLKYTVPSKYIISYKSDSKNNWDYFILVCAIYNSFQIPLSQAYNPYIFKRPAFTALDYIIDIAFLTDIILGFFTTVPDQRGKESWDSRLIYLIYTSTVRFYLDCLSILGAGVFTIISPYFQNFGYIKMTRVFRLSGMIAKINADEATKATMNVTKLLFYLVFYLHAMGCYLWIAVGYNAPEKFYINYERTMYISDENPLKHIYWEPIFCASVGEKCKCGEGKFNIIQGISYSNQTIDYDSGSDGFQLGVLNSSEDNGVECLKLGKSDSCFCDPVGDYDLLWGPPRTIGQKVWPNGPSEEEEDDYSTWAEYPRMWYAPLDWIDFTKSGFFSDAYQFGMQYSSMLYYGVLILGSNELGPVNEVEMLFCVVVLLMSAFMNALILGDIASLAQVVGKRSSEL